MHHFEKNSKIFSPEKPRENVWWPVEVLALSIWGHGPMASAVARAYNGDMGRSPQQGPGAELLVGGQGAKPPEA